MKNLTLLFIIALFSFSTTLHADSPFAVEEMPGCTWNSWFKYPQPNSSYDKGNPVYVKVDPQKYQDIAYMELFVDNHFVRKESQYPYEWCKGSGNSDSRLRNLPAGTHKLKCKIKTKCGSHHVIECTILVKDNHSGGDNCTNCDYSAWFKYPQNGKHFSVGSDVYVKLDAQKYNYIKYVELYVNGHFVRKESNYPYEWAKGSGNGDGKLRNMQPGTYKLKARVYDRCGKYKDFFCTFYVDGGGNTGGGNDVCKYKSWYKYPKNNGSYRYGDDVYVRVDTEKYQDIAEMHLYVNGQLVRKESQYPYEWCKGSGNSDGQLRNLRRGTYNLKCRVKTKCGKWYEYFCKFYVR